MIAAGYEGGNDAAGLRHDPSFKIALECKPLSLVEAKRNRKHFAGVFDRVQTQEIIKLVRTLNEAVAA